MEILKFSQLADYVYYVLYVELFALTLLFVHFYQVRFRNEVGFNRQKKVQRQILASFLDLNYGKINFDDHFSHLRKFRTKDIRNTLLKLMSGNDPVIFELARTVYTATGLLDKDHKALKAFSYFKKMNAMLNIEIVKSSESLGAVTRFHHNTRKNLLKSISARFLIQQEQDIELEPALNLMLSSHQQCLLECLVFLAQKNPVVLKGLYQNLSDDRDGRRLKLAILKVVYKSKCISLVESIQSDLEKQFDLLDTPVIKQMFLCLTLSADEKTEAILEKFRYAADDEISFLAVCTLQQIRPQYKMQLSQFLIDQKRSNLLSSFDRFARSPDTIGYG